MRKIISLLVVVIGVLLASAALITRTPEPRMLMVVVTDEIALKPEFLAQFERETGAKVILQQRANAEALLTQPITADIAYGLDTFTYARAINKDLFEGYASPQLAAIPQRLQSDAQHRLLPVEVNYITVNYDKTYFDARGLPPPTTLRDLTNRKLFHKFVIVAPDTTSIGLAFLALTVASFPEGSAYPWQTYWRDLQHNAVHPVTTWREAYGTLFSATQPPGSDPSATHPLCLSYAAAPLADMHFNQRPQPVMGNVGDVGFELVSYIGINKNTQARTLAQRFVDLLLGKAYQESLASQRFVYPVRSDVVLPANMAQVAPPPAQALTLPPEMIEQNRAQWLAVWRKMFGEN